MNIVQRSIDVVYNPRSRDFVYFPMFRQTRCVHIYTTSVVRNKTCMSHANDAGSVPIALAFSVYRDGSMRSAVFRGVGRYMYMLER